MTVYLPEVGPMVAARAYLISELAQRGLNLPVGVVPPTGEPRPHVLLSRPGGTSRGYLSDYLIRVRVFDWDAVTLERNAELLHRLMLAAGHTRVTTDVGGVWITSAKPQMSPADFDDPATEMFGFQFAVFWTVGLRPER